MPLLDVAAWLIAGSLSFVATIATLELTLGSIVPAKRAAMGDRAVDTVILIPAHDEEAGIGATLERLTAELSEDMRILAVADNCSDRTAAVARALGVEVIERTDPERRGKGYALAFGRDHLKASPPEAVIVLDADASCNHHSLRQLALSTMQTAAPVQAINLLAPDSEAPANVRVAAFAFAAKNEVRQIGLRRLGGPALLNGTGMAFPWPVFASAPLASGHLAEDLQLGIALARRGQFATLVSGARSFSPVSSASGTLSQRTRWERGFLSNSIRHALPTIGLGLVRGSWRLILLGLDLLVPPLALLALLVVAGSIVSLVLPFFGATPVPGILLLATATSLLLSVVAAWWRCGRPYLSAAAMLKLPLYVVWKVPLYLAMLARKPVGWVRTERR